MMLVEVKTLEKRPPYSTPTQYANGSFTFDRVAFESEAGVI